MVIPYGLILLVGTWVLATRHAFIHQSSPLSKWGVGVVALGSTLISPLLPILATVAQLTACVYVIFHRIVTDELTKVDGAHQRSHDGELP